MKEFFEPWTEKERKEYLETNPVLVLFNVNLNKKEAKIEILGKLTEHQKNILLEAITTMFGGIKLTSKVCKKINEYANKWYNKFILKKKARVINSGKKRSGS